MLGRMKKGHQRILDLHASKNPWVKIDTLLSSPLVAMAEDLYFGELLAKVDSLSWEECLDGSYLQQLQACIYLGGARLVLTG